MLAANPTTLERLQAWYAAQTNGVWEHSFGVSITTLDNPGWSVTIELNGTVHENTAFADYRRSFDHATEWLECRKVGHTLQGFGGPSQLEAMLEHLLSWLEADHEVAS